MSYKIVQVLEKDLDFVLSLNQNALSAVSHSTFDKMNHFLKISSYFKILKMKKIPVGFLIGLSPKKIMQAKTTNGLIKDMILFYILIE